MKIPKDLDPKTITESAAREMLENKPKTTRRGVRGGRKKTTKTKSASTRKKSTKKATKKRCFDPRGRLRDTAATSLEESASACPHSRRGLTPLGRLQKYPQIHVSQLTCTKTACYFKKEFFTIMS